VFPESHLRGVARFSGERLHRYFNTPVECIRKRNSHDRLMRQPANEPREPYGQYKPYGLSEIERGPHDLLRFSLGCA
jgi:hypothetical protein